MNKVKNILVLQSTTEILVTVPGLGHGVPVCGFHTRPFIIVINLIFVFSLWCTDWVGSLYANQIFMCFCIKSSIGTQGEVS